MTANNLLMQIQADLMGIDVGMLICGIKWSMVSKKSLYLAHYIDIDRL
jgi:hypothetical protein